MSNTGLTFPYPTWWIIWPILAGLAYAAALYWRNRDQAEWQTSQRILLAALRGIGVALIAFLLLAPALRRLIVKTQKPIIAIAQDASGSVGFTLADSIAYRTGLEGLVERLSRDHEVVTFSFGDEVRDGLSYDFADKSTDIAAALRRMADQYSGQNLGGMVLLSDGIFNSGRNPIYEDAALQAPIFTMGLGDTTIRKDVVVKRLLHNKIAYLGDQFTVQADLAAYNCASAPLRLTVERIEPSGIRRKLKEETLTVAGNDYFETRELILDADAVGVQRYIVSLSTVNGEVSTANNVQEFYVDVLDARQQILLLAHAPHPDLYAFKQVITANKNYEVTIEYADKAAAINWPDYDLVVMHQLPSALHDLDDVLPALVSRNTPLLWIIGAQTDVAALNRAQSLLAITGSNAQPNEVQGTVVAGFNLFTLSDETTALFKRFPPLLAPFGEYRPAANAAILLRQQIGTVATDYPLWLFGESQGQKVGLIAGEGLWKWRLFDFLQHQNYDRFDELLGQTLQYLTVKEDKRRFRVATNQNLYAENEPIFLDAQLYNKSYELVNAPDVQLTITNAEGQEFPFTFNKTRNAYQLRAGFFPVGSYSYTARVKYDGESLEASGRFTVRPVQLELFATTADHNMLRLLSQKSEGAFVPASDWEGLYAAIDAQPNITNKLYDTQETTSLLNLKWLFFVILLLFSLEWFFRRYWGSY